MSTATGSARPPAQTLALVIGVVYLLIGVVGFFVTGFDNFAAPAPDEKLLIFAVNPLHNIVHLAIGIAGVMLARTLDGARTYGMLLAVGYGLAFLYGLFVGDDASANFLNLNFNDDILHLVSALAGVAIVMMVKRPAATT